MKEEVPLFRTFLKIRCREANKKKSTLCENSEICRTKITIFSFERNERLKSSSNHRVLYVIRWFLNLPSWGESASRLIGPRGLFVLVKEEELTRDALIRFRLASLYAFRSFFVPNVQSVQTRTRPPPMLFPSVHRVSLKVHILQGKQIVGS